MCKPLSGLVCLLLTSCAMTNHDVEFYSKSLIGHNLYAREYITQKPKQKINIAVYKFEDQTGKYETTDYGTNTYSKVVTQDPESVLIAKLVGSGWFNVLERKILNSILTERKLNELGDDKTIPKLNYARYALTGGIIDYESNITTGGAGAKYFGIGGSTEYQIDHMTVSLRVIDIDSGEVVISVIDTKKILSYGLNFGIFQFVSFKKLLEAEAGFTRNEPKIIVLNEILEDIITQLITDGKKNGLFS
ncbi:CsgG/HfaB family protein [Cysteiniphilum sp. 19S12-1]|uniref:CsgG/HfaB family protein n=2 Tax=Cysteiniphilum TaxID=2056696 RepID=UPI003F86EAD1